MAVWRSWSERSSACSWWKKAAGSQRPALHQRAGRYVGELAQDLAVPGLIDIAEGQPLRLKLIRATADDLDRDFLLQAEIGLPVDILEPLPRTPRSPSGRTQR